MVYTYSVIGESMVVLKIIFFPITLLWWGIVQISCLFKRVYIGMFLRKTTISNIDALTGEQFEDFAKLMFEYAGYKAVKTAQSGDYGADLVLTKKSKIVVQAKLYYKHGVGNHSVQEVVSAIKYYSADFACVITNWKFTPNAITLANVHKVILIDREEVIKFLLDVKNGTKKSVIFNLDKVYRLSVLQG